MQITLVTAFLILALLTPQGLTTDVGQRTTKKTVYLLQDAGNNRWCAFRSQAMWRSRVESLTANVTGNIDYVAGRVAEVGVSQADESGDWTVYDLYSVDETGKIRRLKRTINVLPGDRNVVQLFSIHNGQIRKLSSTSRVLSTMKLSKQPLPWLPDVPILASTGEFSFSSLLDSRKIKWSDGEACVPSLPGGGA